MRNEILLFEKRGFLLKIDDLSGHKIQEDFKKTILQGKSRVLFQYSRSLNFEKVGMVINSKRLKGRRDKIYRVILEKYLLKRSVLKTKRTYKDVI